MVKYTFKRSELKYIIDKSTFDKIIDIISLHLKKDKYGLTTIQSLYFDKDDYLLIRRSIEKPIYKEKLRLRSYGLVSSSDLVFLEIKKKYDGIVYKRRIKISQDDTFSWFENKIRPDEKQKTKEIDYFINFYKDLKPKMLMLYDRIAYEEENTKLRITFDFNTRYRVDNLTLDYDLNGMHILDEDKIIMEIKTNLAYPLWLCKLLSENKIYKTSFSKYGNAYKKAILRREKINV